MIMTGIYFAINTSSVSSGSGGAVVVVVEVAVVVAVLVAGVSLADVISVGEMPDVFDCGDDTSPPHPLHPVRVIIQMSAAVKKVIFI